MNNRWDLLAAAIKSAVNAGKAILEVYEKKDFGVEKKADDSPLTLADRRAHDIIVKGIDGFDIPILSEEGKKIPFNERKAWQYMWIVDPLDGTKEFIKRNGEFTVNIALAEEGTPTMGVIYVPVTDTLYLGDKTKGAFRIENFKKFEWSEDRSQGDNALELLLGKAIQLPQARDQNRPYTIMGSRSHATPELEAYVEEMREKFGNVEFISAGSSLKICKVAEGRADVYPRLGPTMEWDTAAGQAIAEASGATVVRHDTGTPLTYNKEDLLNPWFIVKR
jgi:3'(2'), 5'-bisphosphate nucleotidase